MILQHSPLGSSCSILAPHTSCSLRPLAASTSTTARGADTPSLLHTALARGLSDCRLKNLTGLNRLAAAALWAYWVASCLNQACTGLNGSLLLLLLAPKMLLGIIVPLLLLLLLLDAGLPSCTPMLANTSAVLLLVLLAAPMPLLLALLRKPKPELRSVWAWNLMRGSDALCSCSQTAPDRAGQAEEIWVSTKKSALLCVL